MLLNLTSLLPLQWPPFNPPQLDLPTGAAVAKAKSGRGHSFPPVRMGFAKRNLKNRQITRVQRFV